MLTTCLLEWVGSGGVRESLAVKEAEKSDKRVVLIDGEKLAHLMIKYSVGVKKARDPIEIQEVDDDYFEDL